MGLGETIEVEFITFSDKDTGVDVTRLSDNVGNTLHPYFTQNLLRSDDGMLLCASDRTGAWQLFLLDLRDECMIQITEGTSIAPGAPCLTHDGKTTFYWDGGSLMMVNNKTLETQRIFELPEGWRPTKLSITRDGRFLAFAIGEIIKLWELLTKNKISSHLHLGLYARPRSILFRYDVKCGEAMPVWGEQAWITHVNIHPLNPDLILFNHEGPWHLVQRMWVANAETHEIYPLLPYRRIYERAGHEFFTDGGRVAAQYSRRYSPSSQEWECFDVFLDIDGSNVKMYRYERNIRTPSHMFSRDEKIGVIDRSYLTRDREDDSYVSSVRYEEGKAILKPICRHGSTWSGQAAHPHPIITFDKKHVIFTSNMEGRENLYMAPIAI
ncbi:MAG: oligogalacturonate lyase family protein [Nitrososphaerota archaeon]|nr:oligogalacturonate lyase family protein [Candidatus Bathyarchaeota archaeon]MDW8048354.1 oligogalacturonate lyase family protein [Nitrososphaerota archaeon]